jgi:ankyrin repeat protein
VLSEVAARLHRLQDGNTALHHAASAGNLEAVQLLLDCGVLVGAVNKVRSTPSTSRPHCRAHRAITQQGSEACKPRCVPGLTINQSRVLWLVLSWHGVMAGCCRRG